MKLFSLVLSFAGIHVTSITLNRTFDELEVTAMGDTSHKFVKGLEASSSLIDPNQIVSNKYTLLEHLTIGQVDPEKVKDEVLQEFQTYDKDVRMLTYKILLEKFNGKYSDLYESQKEVLKEFITSVDSTPKLRNFYNTKIQELKSELTSISKTITDKVVQIKLNEVLPLIVELDKNYPIKNDNLVDLLQYCELVEELKAANGKPIK